MITNLVENIEKWSLNNNSSRFCKGQYKLYSCFVCLYLIDILIRTRTNISLNE